ncbi:MAG: rhodanese-like domain-containing protein [Defluviicoccus sp.]
MQTIKHGDLFEWIQTGQSMTLVEVLPRECFRDFHLPNAINVPFDEHFDEEILRAVPTRSAPVVVYCQDAGCQASAAAARRLEALGYTNVYHYAAGKSDWKDAGLRIESMSFVD